MAILDTQTIETISLDDLKSIPTKTLKRYFGEVNDSIELNIYDENNLLVLSDERFTDYKAYFNNPGTTSNKAKTKSIDINYEQVLKDYGYTSGTYKLDFSFQRKLFSNSFLRNLHIAEISPSRTEIIIGSKTLSPQQVLKYIGDLSYILLNSSYIKDINLNFGKGITALVINAQVIDGKAALKLYNPLSNRLGVNSSFRVFEEIINPLQVTVQLEGAPVEEIGIDIGSPNFNLKNDNIFTVPSGQKTFDQILNNGAVTSSFNRVQNLLSGSGVQIDLEFDNIDTPSGYHFENFIHFSSATERLRNFKYKLELLETYSGSIASLNNITGSVTASNFVNENLSILRNKEDKLIQGFDYYERYLYYESGAYAWPKTNTTCPYTNAKTDSAAAISWFGAPVDDYESAFYGGQMLSASKFDDCNQYNLVNTIPPHIRDNSQNDKYTLFVEMIAQHFDGIWAYVDSITDLNEAYSGLKDGISKDLVLNQLTSRGISAYDQFSNASLYEYLIGDDGTETFEYTPTDGSILISASNCPIPKGDIAKEIWKRLYHNSSYLLKTKGTERGLKALIACYGIPETVLHVKEYGGPLQDKTKFRTFSYQKESKMVNAVGANTTSALNSIVRTIGNIFNPVSSSYAFSNGKTAKSIQFRYLPDSNNKSVPQDLLTLSTQGAGNVPDVGILVSQSIDPTLINSESFAHLILVTGSANNNLSDNKVISSQLVPFFNGGVWNITLTLDSGSSNDINVYATQTTFNKNTYVASCSLNAPEVFSDSDYPDYQVFLRPSSNALGINYAFGPDSGPCVHSGSFQEYRIWTEILSRSTIVTQSLSPFNYNGNGAASSYNDLVIRIPLGSDLIETGSGGKLNSEDLNHAPNPSLAFALFTSGASPGNQFFVHPGQYISIEETHHLTTPDTVGSGMVSDKVRIDNGTFDDNFLDPHISVETSPQDRQPLDYSDLGVFFSPTFEVNEDIIYTLGGFRLDDYIGDPTHYTSGSYPDLKTIKDIYFQKVENRLKIGDYIRTIQFFDHTLFKMIKEFVPAKVNLKTGLVIEPHYLERTKIAGTNVDYEQKPEHLASYSPSGSITATNETAHDVFIDVVDYIDDGSYSTATENVAQTNRLSNKYFLR